MSLDNTERLYLERQVTLARAVIAALSLVALLEASVKHFPRPAVIFVSAYLVAALVVVVLQRFTDSPWARIPLVVDFIVLAIFGCVTPSVAAFWFLFMFAVFALATRANTRAVLLLVSVATVGIILRFALANSNRWQRIWHWIAIGFGTIVSGLCMGFLGAREREHFAKQQFLERLTGHLRYDRGLTESIRQALGELTLAFECEQACLAIRDDDLERIFAWKVCLGDRDPRGPETLPLARSDTFLIDSLEVSMAWEQRNGNPDGASFGWDRQTGQRYRAPLPPTSTREEFGARSLLAATFESSERPVGRVLLINRRKSSENGALRPFSEGDLRWLEQIVRYMGPPLENVFILRNLRTRAVESERSRISRDLHDGILQTLLSLKIQLDVLRNKLSENPEAAQELGNLQKTVHQESDELRRFVTEMRPVRVESADMKELMYGFAERFRTEHGLAVDLFIEARDLRLPDRICRELFQIYRESLHNVKKHANASHVVVKLDHDEAKVFLVVDDNGRGFSFSGRYTSEELDRLRLGPISIKERTRSVGGTLTVESNPGHGARLTIEIPVN